MPIDTADKFTTAEINRIERELQALYSATFRDVKKQLADVVAKMDLGGDLTPQQRYLNAQKYNRLNALQAQLSEALQNTNREAMRIINKSNVNVYAENYNYTLERLEEYAPNLTFPTIDKAGVAKILRGEVTPFTHMALDNIKDRDIIERALTRELTSGIMQGEGIPKLANRIKEQTNKNLFQSTRIARTESNRIQNAGRQDAFDKGEDMGLHIVKRWVSTHDSRTRESHTAANGQTVPNGKPFVIGGQELMFPSDQTAAPEESINCRCTVVSEVVTKVQYDYVVEQYEKGNYFPDWKNVKEVKPKEEVKAVEEREEEAEQSLMDEVEEMPEKDIERTAENIENAVSSIENELKRLYQDFDIKTEYSKSTNSVYMNLYNKTTEESLKIRFSDHSNQSVFSTKEADFNYVVEGDRIYQVRSDGQLNPQPVHFEDIVDNTASYSDLTKNEEEWEKEHDKWRIERELQEAREIEKAAIAEREKLERAAAEQEGIFVDLNHEKEEFLKAIENGEIETIKVITKSGKEAERYIVPAKFTRIRAEYLGKQFARDVVLANV